MLLQTSHPLGETEGNQRRQTGAMVWKKARGKLGAFAPLLGTWSADAESPQGPIRCQRTFSKVLRESHIHLQLARIDLLLFPDDKSDLVKSSGTTWDEVVKDADKAGQPIPDPFAIGANSVPELAALRCERHQPFRPTQASARQDA